MISSQRRLRLCRALIALNLLFIWGNSALPGEVSQAFSDWVKAIIEAIFPGEGTSGGGGLLRKLAHFSEFAALGLLLTWLHGMLRKKIPFALLWGMGAACVDETIQRFVPGRGPSLRDVGIDTCGVAAGMILLLLGHSYWKRRSTKLSLEDTI